MLNTLLTATLVPGFTFACFFVIDISLLSVGSSGRRARLDALDVGGPVVRRVRAARLFGGLRGIQEGRRAPESRRPTSDFNTTRVHLRSRVSFLVPPQPWYMHPALTTIFGGILPFGAVSVELFFVMSAIWLHQIYYIFGFLFLVSMILVATCAEITILFCYFQLCNEDYAWWWRSVMSSGACADTCSSMRSGTSSVNWKSTGGVPSTLYFGYMTLVSGIFFLVTGAIGFYACLWFVNKIYGSIKVD